MMQAQLSKIDDNNMQECIALSVTEEQAQYICPNQDSLKDASDNPAVARPFAIYVDNRMVGFTMFAFDEDYEDPNDRYWLWRFMIDQDLQGRGYGRAALKAIIDYLRSKGLAISNYLRRRVTVKRFPYTISLVSAKMAR